MKRPVRFDDDDLPEPSIPASRRDLNHDRTNRLPPIGDLSNVVAEDAQQTALITRVWGETILTEPVKVKAILDAQNIVREASLNMMQAGLNVGRAMNELQSRLSREEFNRGLRASHTAFHGWSTGNINKAMRAARFIDDNRPLAALAPQSFSVIYEFTTLDAHSLKRAVDLRLFRPDVRRVDVQAFKKKIAIPDESKAALDSPFRPDIERLDIRLRALESEINKVRKRRVDLLAKEGAWKARGGASSQ